MFARIAVPGSCARAGAVIANVSKAVATIAVKILLMTSPLLIRFCHPYSLVFGTRVVSLELPCHAMDHRRFTRFGRKHRPRAGRAENAVVHVEAFFLPPVKKATR
jgi:hypothetical protein